MKKVGQLDHEITNQVDLGLKCTIHSHTYAASLLLLLLVYGFHPISV